MPTLYSLPFSSRASSCPILASVTWVNSDGFIVNSYIITTYRVLGSSILRGVIVDAHLDIGWNAISAGRGFLAPPAPGYLLSRSPLIPAGVGLVFATLYTAPARAGLCTESRTPGRHRR